MPAELRIATRRSRLALWQAEHVAARLAAMHEDLAVRLLPIVTEGDRILDRSLAAVGGKGLFVKELEQAMLDGRADLAVHSMKDMPARLPPGLTIAAVLPRADPRDAFVSAQHPTLAALPAGSRVGTSSLRRQCQLLATRPDLSLLPLRGNVETRLRKLDDGEYDAIVLACAGLLRLGLSDRIRARLPATTLLPAVGQGIIGIECRDDDERTLQLLAPLEDAPTRICLTAERSFAAQLGGSCQSPIAGHAWLFGDRVHLSGLVGSPDGRQVLSDETSGHLADADLLGRQLADRMLAAGAGRLLEQLQHGT